MHFTDSLHYLSWFTPQSYCSPKASSFTINSYQFSIRSFVVQHWRAEEVLIIPYITIPSPKKHQFPIRYPSKDLIFLLPSHVCLQILKVRIILMNNTTSLFLLHKKNICCPENRGTKKKDTQRRSQENKYPEDSDHGISK